MSAGCGPAPVLHGRTCYEVEFGDGTVIVADADHQWLTETRASRGPAASVKTTRQIAESLRCDTVDRRPDHSVPVAAPLTLDDADLPLPPYALGVWLGAGHPAAAQVTTADPEIAWHLGADVGPVESGIREFGYFEITPTAEAGDFLDRPLFLPQNHFHTFALPAGAVHLASSETFPNQAFRIGDKTYALQFHAEQGPAGFRRWQERQGAPYGTLGAQDRDEQDRLMEAHHAAQLAWFSGFVTKLFG